MMDVWWGLVEREVTGSCNWGGYAELLEMAKKHRLKVQAVEGNGWLNLWWLGFFIFELLWLLVFFFLWGGGGFAEILLLVFCLGFINEILLRVRHVLLGGCSGFGLVVGR